jgi:hypothetical protein
MSTITSLLIALRHLDYLPWMRWLQLTQLIFSNEYFALGLGNCEYDKSIQKIHNPDLDIEGLFVNHVWF